MHKARLLHRHAAHPDSRRKRAASLTVDERSFQNPKLRAAFLIAYKTAADLAGKASLFVVTIVAARLLSTEAFGIFSLGTTLGWMIAVVTDSGIQLHVARAIARRSDQSEALLRAWLRVRLWTAGVAVALVAIGAAAAGWRSTYALPIALFAAVYACSGLVEFLHYIYRGLSRTDIESSLTLWHRAAMLVCAIVTLAWTRSVTALAIAMLVPAAATLLVSVRIARTLTAERAVERADVTVRVRGDARAIWPIGAGIVLSALYFRIDVFLVQYWSGTEAVGLYNAVFRLVDALRLFPAAAIAVALPALCRGTDLRPLARAAAPMTLAASVAAIALWAAAGWLVPLLYQARYAAAVPAFRILLLSFPLMTLNMALTHQLVGWDRQHVYAALCAAALVVNVALNARLIPALSIDGAAWATLGTEAFLTIGCVAAIRTAAGRVGQRYAGPDARPLSEILAR
jgi:O-antigen/teichoic acid export membrane protein